MYKSNTHTQDSIVVYVTYEEKEEIRKMAGKNGMSAYLLNLHKINKHKVLEEEVRREMFKE